MIAVCGHGEAASNADFCIDCVHNYEAEQAEQGYAEAPCVNGHYGCAHREGGACHAEANGGKEQGPAACPNGKPNCKW